MTVEFDIGHDDQAKRLADELFGFGEVLTVRVGGPGERSVYRVDVPRGGVDADEIVRQPAVSSAMRLGVGVQVVRAIVSRDGFGDPDVPER